VGLGVWIPFLVETDPGADGIIGTPFALVSCATSWSCAFSAMRLF
jgi:hypothetical protein